MSQDQDYNRAMSALIAAMPCLHENLSIVARRNPGYPATYIKLLEAGLNLLPAEETAPAAAALSLLPTAADISTEPANDKDAGALAAKSRQTRKAVPRFQLEYAVLKLLEHRGGKRTDKTVLYRAITALPLDIGNLQAFSTRLNGFRDEALIDWEKNKQNAPITLTAAGIKRRIELEQCGPRGLTPEIMDWFSSLPDWVGNQRQSMLDRKPDAPLLSGPGAGRA